MTLDQDPSVPLRPAARLLGPHVQPFSILAARSEAERAERFPFTEADQALLDKILRENAP